MLALNRIYRLTIGDQVIDELRCQFVISQGFQNQVSRGQFKINNLSETNYNRVEKDQLVSFEVMDSNGVYQIGFIGNLINKNPEYSDGGTISTLYCWSGSTRFKELTSRTFEVNSRAVQVLSWLKSQLSPFTFNVSISAQNLIDSYIYTNGVTFYGSMRNVLEKFGTMIGEKVTVDNNEIFIGQMESQTHIVSTELQNLIGTPGVNVAETDITTPLMFEARIGDLVDLTSTYFYYASDEAKVVSQQNRSGSGKYKIMNLNHEGDTHTDSDLWKTDHNLLVLNYE